MGLKHDIMGFIAVMDDGCMLMGNDGGVGMIGDAEMHEKEAQRAYCCRYTLPICYQYHGAHVHGPCKVAS